MTSPVPSADAIAAPPTAPRPLLPMLLAVPLAAVAGVCLNYAFPGAALWPLAFAAIVLALLTLMGRSVGGAFLAGLVFGAVFYLMKVVFTARYLGPIPWLGLSGLEAILTAAGAIPIALGYRWFGRLNPGRVQRLIWLPTLISALWTARELFLGTFPYGGFPWARIGMSQVSGPFAQVASWVGVTGLTFLLVWVCAFGIEIVRTLGREPRRQLVRPGAVLVLSVVLLAVVPAFPTQAAGDMRVGSVQGNGPSGYFDHRTPNAVLDAQLAATQPLIGKPMDVLLWPEGGLDSDPLNNATTALALTRLSVQADAPLIVDAATDRDGVTYNTSILWEGAAGATALHDKRHPVPMGEYVPDRWFFEAIVPDLIGLIGREYTPGTNSPVFDVNGTPVGLAICFDVIYDDVLYEGANDGAEVYMFQTNNADFRGTDENLQQLAMARMRAIETGRSVVNISTVGTSQVIGPDGRTIDELVADEPGAMLTDVPLRTGITPAVVLGPWLNVLLLWGSLAVLVLIRVVVAVRSRRVSVE